jgi:hypothetical protein
VSASEKHELVRLVEGSSLSVWPRTLAEIGLPARRFTPGTNPTWRRHERANVNNRSPGPQEIAYLSIEPELEAFSPL